MVRPETTQTAASPRAEIRAIPAKRSRRYSREHWLGSVMALPVLVPFLIFGLLPLLWLIVVGFTDYDGFRHFSWVGFDNYIEVATDSLWWASVKNSLIVAVGTVIIQVPLGFVLAVILDRKFRGNTAFRTIFFMPYVVPAAISGIVIGFLIQPTRGGVLNDLSLSLGIIHSPANFLADGNGALTWIVIVSAWIEFGFTMVLFLAALQSISPDIYEAAELDGASPFQRVRFIVLPMLRPMFNIIMLLAIVSVMRSFDVVKTLTNGGPAGASDVIFTHIYSQFFESSVAPRVGYASALAVTASIIIALVVGLYFMASKQRKTR